MNIFKEIKILSDYRVLPISRMACSYAEDGQDPIVRKNFNFLENIIKHRRPLSTYIRNMNEYVK